MKEQEPSDYFVTNKEPTVDDYEEGHILDSFRPIYKIKDY